MKRAVFVLAAVALIVSAPALRRVAERVWFVIALSTETPPAQLVMPVDGVDARRLSNSWRAPRAGGRQHEGIDIFAPKGTPVVSTTRGIVVRVGTNRLGGQVVTVLGPGLEWHYYAHLDRFGSVREGDLVQPGDVLGYVGSTGNARGTPSHLHYGIYQRGAKNPYSRLAAP
jgi:murein DD-endopeptidase MepM/ murein hydrolase activator NlpD